MTYNFEGILLAVITPKNFDVLDIFTFVKTAVWTLTNILYTLSPGLFYILKNYPTTEQMRVTDGREVGQSVG